MFIYVYVYMCMQRCSNVCSNINNDNFLIVGFWVTFLSVVLNIVWIVLELTFTIASPNIVFKFKNRKGTSIISYICITLQSTLQKISRYLTSCEPHTVLWMKKEVSSHFCFTDEETKDKWFSWGYNTQLKLQTGLKLRSFESKFTILSTG